MLVLIKIFPPLSTVLYFYLAGSGPDGEGDLEDEDQQSPLTQLSVSSEMVARSGARSLSLSLSLRATLSALTEFGDYFQHYFYFYSARDVLLTQETQNYRSFHKNSNQIDFFLKNKV